MISAEASRSAPQPLRARLVVVLGAEVSDQLFAAQVAERVLQLHQENIVFAEAGWPSTELSDRPEMNTSPRGSTATAETWLDWDRPLEMSANASGTL